MRMRHSRAVGGVRMIKLYSTMGIVLFCFAFVLSRVNTGGWMDGVPDWGIGVGLALSFTSRASGTGWRRRDQSYGMVFRLRGWYICFVDF